MAIATGVKESYGICVKCQQEGLLGDGLCVDCWDGKPKACKYCGSESIIKTGTYYKNQRWRCTKCEHTFFNLNNDIRSRYSREIKLAVVDLRRGGLTCRGIQVELHKKTGLPISRSTVCKWLNKSNTFPPDRIMHSRLPFNMLLDTAELNEGKILTLNKIKDLFACAPQTKIKDTQIYRLGLIRRINRYDWEVKPKLEAL